jgi:hypothetical protein
MTKDECIAKLRQHCKDQEGGLFNKRNIAFERTRLFEPHERTANLPLPDKIEIRNINLDPNGIKVGPILYSWSAICATGLKAETFPDNTPFEGSNYYDNFLLLCLNDGKIIEIELGSIKQFYGQLGHFIEQYKSGHLTKA